jgi:hypothetical protein
LALPVQVIWDLEGCQQNADYLSTVPVSVYGTGSAVFSAVSSVQVTVSHVLGAVPGHVSVTPNQSSAGFTVAWDQATETTFRVTLDAGGSVSATVPFTWVAFA